MKIKYIAVALLLSMPVYAKRYKTVQNLINDTEDKVVKIGIVSNKSRGSCSGGFISERGLVLTCAHCFTHGDKDEMVQKIFIKTREGYVYPAAILHIDTERDLAIIAPDNLGPFKYFEYGDEPDRGQKVLSFGSPLGFQKTVTLGWVSNILKQTKMLIFHSAFISPGSSGGPLVDLEGKLIGVNEATIGYGFLQTAQGMFVAIDIVTVKEFLRGVSFR